MTRPTLEVADILRVHGDRFLVGTAVTSLLIVPALKNFQKGTTNNTHWKAVITFNTTDKSCTQFASRNNFGNAVKYSFPVLSQGGSDIIMWRGRIDAGPPNLRVHVEFPDLTSSPFTDYRYDGNIDVGPVRSDADYGDYSFAMGKVTVTDPNGNIQTCTSFKDPGVHIDQ
jgi:hypothetical protein